LNSWAFAYPVIAAACTRPSCAGSGIARIGQPRPIANKVVHNRFMRDPAEVNWEKTALPPTCWKRFMGEV